MIIKELMIADYNLRNYPFRTEGYFFDNQQQLTSGIELLNPQYD